MKEMIDKKDKISKKQSSKASVVINELQAQLVDMRFQLEEQRAMNKGYRPSTVFLGAAGSGKTRRLTIDSDANRQNADITTIWISLDNIRDGVEEIIFDMKFSGEVEIEDGGDHHFRVARDMLDESFGAKKKGADLIYNLQEFVQSSLTPCHLVIDEIGLLLGRVLDEKLILDLIDIIRRGGGCFSVGCNQGWRNMGPFIHRAEDTIVLRMQDNDREEVKEMIAQVGGVKQR